ncbi:MAG: DMT family transporter [Planktothrix sp.]|uniref:DMT family transporter n=1 Tax=Planktothrix sp. TaxID=3088171 RepID=UPI0038D50484
MTLSQPKFQHIQGIILLIAVTLLWGTTFPLVKDTIHNISPGVLIAIRSALAAIAFSLHLRTLNLKLIRDGILLGILLFASLAIQAIALETLSANRAAFIASLNVILVPLLGQLLGQKVRRGLFLAAGLALMGVGVMSWEGGMLTAGDLWMLLDVLLYTSYILLLEAVTCTHSSQPLTAIQLVVMTVLATVWTLPDLMGQWQGIEGHYVPLLYLAVVTAITTWLPAIAQHWVSASETAVIYTFEPVFASVFSFWLLGETLGLRGWLGGAMIVGAMLISQQQTHSMEVESKIISEENFLIPTIEPMVMNDEMCIDFSWHHPEAEAEKIPILVTSIPHSELIRQEIEELEKQVSIQ